LTIPELDSIITIEIKTLITQLELFDNLKRFYDKKISEGKHHYSALNAVAAKLLRIVYWVLKNNREYFMLNPANGGASHGVWGRNPSAIRLMLTESVNSTLICGSVYFRASIL